MLSLNTRNECSGWPSTRSSKSSARTFHKCGCQNLSGAVAAEAGSPSPKGCVPTFQNTRLQLNHAPLRAEPARPLGSSWIARVVGSDLSRLSELSWIASKSARSGRDWRCARSGTMPRHRKTKLFRGKFYKPKVKFSYSNRSWSLRKYSYISYQHPHVTILQFYKWKQTFIEPKLTKLSVCCLTQELGRIYENSEWTAQIADLSRIETNTNTLILLGNDVKPLTETFYPYSYIFVIKLDVQKSPIQ